MKPSNYINAILETPEDVNLMIVSRGKESAEAVWLLGIRHFDKHHDLNMPREIQIVDKVPVRFLHMMPWEISTTHEGEKWIVVP